MRHLIASSAISSRPSASALFLALALAAAIPTASAQWEGGPADVDATAAPAGATYARVRHIEGPVTLLQDRTYVETDVAANAPLVPGDTVETGTDGRLEVQLADGSLLWMSGSTRLSVQALADGASRFENRTLLSLDGGSVVLDVQPFDAEDKLLRIDTDAATVFLLESGLYRLDVRRDGALRVTSRRGVAEVLARDESALVRSGETTFVYPGGTPDAPALASVRSGDPFDDWVRARRDTYRVAREAASYAAYAEEIPATVQPYLVEMESYGTWQRHADYGPVWVPVVRAGWRPYYYGSWRWRPVGWVWVSSDPWGYAPYHYGRWEFVAGWGWCWLPGSVYAPAWVSWGYSGAYVGWAPLGWYNYPSGWHLSVHFGAYRHRYSCWTFVQPRHFHHRHVDKVAVKEQAIAGDVVRAQRPPRVSMDDVRARREEAAFAAARSEAASRGEGRAGGGAERASPVSFRQGERRASATSSAAANRGRGRPGATSPTVGDRSRQTGSGAAAGRGVPRAGAVTPDDGRLPGRSVGRQAAPRTTREAPAREPRRILTDTRTRRTPVRQPEAASRAPETGRRPESTRDSGRDGRRDSAGSRERPPAADGSTVSRSAPPPSRTRPQAERPSSRTPSRARPPSPSRSSRPDAAARPAPGPSRGSASAGRGDRTAPRNGSSAGQSSGRAGRGGSSADRSGDRSASPGKGGSGGSGRGGSRGGGSGKRGR